MKIEFDYDFSDEHLMGTHFIDTDDAFAMGVIRRLSNGTQPVAGSGWDEISSHPAYVGKTRLDVVVGELNRLGVKL